MPNERQFGGFMRTRGDASRVNSNSRGQLTILVPVSDRDLHFASVADFNTDWNVSNPTHPSVYIHSETTPATDYMSMAHDGTTLTFTLAGGDYFTFASGDLVIANSQGLIVGNTAQVVVSDGDGATNLTPEVQVLGTTKTDGSLLIGSWNTTNNATVAPMLGFLKSGNAAIGSQTTVAADEVLGELVWFGDDGTDYESAAAAIRVEADATIGTGDMPGRIVFLTTADGGETLTEGLRITSGQAVLATSPTGGLGYRTGAGGTVTQATNKSTGVTLSKVVGQITMNGEALGAGAEVSFVVTNTAVAAVDTVIVNHGSAGTAGAYLVGVGAVGAGSFTVTVSNVSAGSLSEAIVINYAVIKGASA